ncbi:hypothetical protein G7078_03615 [Sphingomonas sinipercae]|uniref:Uncharacterized protein n=1 Tax=Sphingomonas sinipercae TaxID=2714944 RepID=A0A6G7ZLV8_9SPHN|nr:hypothetical protein [Sphingomonas sinipercae]QIL01964.1 hypothetical protein G7078_03615 [Sphingomonas sinipercae]
MDMQRALNPEIAVRGEYDAAVKANTRYAYDLFIARHPGHPLAAAAKEKRAALDQQ